MKAVRSALLIASLGSLLFSCKDDDAPTPDSPLSGNYDFKESRITGRLVVISDTEVSDSVVTNYSYTATGSGEVQIDNKYIHQKNITYKYVAQTNYMTYFNGEVTNQGETKSEEDVVSFTKKIEYEIRKDTLHFSEPLLDNGKDLVAFPLHGGGYMTLEGSATLVLGYTTEKRDTTTTDGIRKITIRKETHAIPLAKKLN
ncbi:hypothetical protein [Chitinophaga agri]|uniref:Uncharacterized protein n=1 Tax=Chitinophaga agri TaxID=2703787 RepID=A0A6B9ZCG9_9BACT|nr:hypothetical protein [Chitinophaga agri]QHS58815.1 hypothetical protein GWR21_04105 [Chitinophaga agri]